MKLPAAVRDRDVFQDSEDRIFITLGYIQPPERIISLLKYVRNKTGTWKSQGTSYERVFWGGVDSVVSGEKQVPPEYLHSDPHFGVSLIAPPKKSIRQYFQPEERLREILQEGSGDILEERARYLAEALHDQLGIPLDSIGVAGSILWKGHSPEFSDINMNLYGKENVERLRIGYSDVWRNDSKLTVREPADWKNAIARVQSRVPPLSSHDLESLFSRRQAICVDNQCIGITPILYPEEVPIRYGSEQYRTIQTKTVTIATTIVESEYSCYHPAIYDLEPVVLESPTGVKVGRLMVYDGAFGGLLKEGDPIEASGTLQEIVEDDEIVGHQLMIGTKTGSGKEFIRFLT
jgi:predicted nucleotidyltransferase